MNLVGSAVTGRYEAIGNLADATHIIAQSFGFQEGPKGEHLPGPVNQDLGIFLGGLVLANPRIRELPRILQHEVADALPQAVLDRRGTAEQIIKEPGDPNVKYLDSWEVFRQAKALTDEFGDWYSRPLVIAQAHHVGRVAAQAKKIGYDPIVPRGLPDTFDPQSAQPWIRSRGAWVRRELPAMAYLKLRGRL